MNETTFEPAKRAAEKVGGAAELARITGVSIQAVYQWINGERPVPAKHAPLIERDSGVPCEELCPTVPWGIVRRESSAAA